MSEIEAARAAVGDITTEAEFCVSPIGTLRREDTEIALASEVLRLRAVMETAFQMLCDCEGAANVAVTLRVGLDNNGSPA